MTMTVCLTINLSTPHSLYLGYQEALLTSLLQVGCLPSLGKGEFTCPEVRGKNQLSRVVHTGGLKSSPGTGSASSPLYSLAVLLEKSDCG